VWTDPNPIDGIFQQWSFYAHGEMQRRILSLILYAMPWSVWLARNNCIFNDFVLD